MKEEWESNDDELQTKKELSFENNDNERLARIIGGNLATKIVNVSEYMIQFKVLVFLKFWIYHLLFFYVGFLSLLVITIVDSFSLVINMQFWFSSKVKATFILQIMQWLCVLTTTLFWVGKYYQIFPFRIELKNIPFELFILFQSQCILRCFIIAVRYGYISNLRLKLLDSKPQLGDYINKDLLIRQWIALNPDNIKTELEATLWRNEVEER